MSLERGLYITIEGGEGCGKSTQSKLLRNHLVEKGFNCKIAREPGGTKEAEAIRGVLLNPKFNISRESELFLFEASRSQLFPQEIKKGLKKGIIYIADRSGFSSEAYQGYGRGLDLELIKKLNEIATYGISPDLAFFINIDPELGLSHLELRDRIENESLEFHRRINKGYLEIAEQNKDICIVIQYRDKGMRDEIRKHVKDRLNI